MNKFKFLSYAAIAAFMTVGFTSCEKEDFKTEVEAPVIPEIPEFPEIPEAAPAVVTISPSVIYFENGSAKNVTSQSTITYDAPKAGADGTIKATDVVVTVKYTAEVEVMGETLKKELTATETVKVPDLAKGMCCALTPTIVFTVNTSVDMPSAEHGVATEATPLVSNTAVKNTTDYFYTDVKGEYKFKTGTEVDESSIKWLRPEFKNDETINNMIKGHNQVVMQTKKVENIVVMAQSQTLIKVTTKVSSTAYSIKKKISLSRASEAEVEIVKFNVLSYESTTDNASAGPKSESNPNGYEVNVNLGGEGHGHGHGHGTGHGDAGNAGGGIIWGE